MSNSYKIKIDGIKITEGRGDIAQVDLAHEIGCKQNELCAWEHNRRSIPGKFLARICSELNLPVEYFTKREE